MRRQDHSQGSRARSSAAVALAACLALFAGPAAGVEGTGVKFGEGRVHPFFQLESRYDSAALYAVDPQTHQSQLLGDLILHFRPGFRLEMPSPTFAVDLNADLDYALYTLNKSFGPNSPSHLQGDADLDLGVNRSGKIGLDLGDHVVRSDRAMVPSVAVGVLSLFNDARAQINFRPSGGALQVEPSYHLTTELFSTLLGGSIPGCADTYCNPANIPGLDYLQHTFSLNARWRFLPKTAVTLDSAFGMRSYLSGTSPNNNSLKAALGLAGLLSTHLSTVLRVGWGQDFTSSTYKSVIGQAEVGYLLSETGQIRLGYLRTFEPVGGSFITYGDDRAYLDTRFLLGGRLTLRAVGNFDFLTFRGPQARSDTRVTFDAGADYEAKQWFSIGAGDMVTYASYGSSASKLTRNEVYLRLQVIY